MLLPADYERVLIKVIPHEGAPNDQTCHVARLIGDLLGPRHWHMDGGGSYPFGHFRVVGWRPIPVNGWSELQPALPAPQEG